MTRRRCLVGLGAVGLSAPFGARAGSEPDLPTVRRWRGRGHITVVATSFGDVRLPPGVDDAEALWIANTLVAKGRPQLVAASGVPAEEPPLPGDVARVVAGLCDGCTVQDGGRSEFDAVMELADVAWGLESVEDDLFRARRVALAMTPFALNSRAIDAYAQQRSEALTQVGAATEAIDAAVAMRVAALPRQAIVMTRALGASRLCDALEAAGRGGRLLATEEARTLLDGEDLFWAGMEAGLPQPGEEGLMPWARSLEGFFAAFASSSGSRSPRAGTACTSRWNA